MDNLFDENFTLSKKFTNAISKMKFTKILLANLNALKPFKLQKKTKVHSIGMRFHVCVTLDIEKDTLKKNRENEILKAVLNVHFSDKQ